MIKEFFKEKVLSYITDDYTMMSNNNVKVKKLVRDVILDWRPEKTYVERNKSRLLDHFKVKVVEESFEVLLSESKEELTDELGDVLDLIDGIMKIEGINMRDIMKSQKAKADKRGRFEKGVIFEDIRTLNNNIIHKEGPH